MNLSDRKRALLTEMGVDVWVLRSARPVAPPAQPEAASGRPEVKARRTLSQPVTPPAPVRDSSPDPAIAVSVATTEVAKAPPVPPFRVACFAKGDVLMLVEPGTAKAAVRFALDLLSAASGIWGGELDRLDFDWPQPGIENNASTRSRALGAFVAKQMGDRDPGLVLVGQEVAERLEQIPAGCLMLPPLGALMTQGELKRQVWAQLQERR